MNDSRDADPSPEGTAESVETDANTPDSTIGTPADSDGAPNGAEHRSLAHGLISLAALGIVFGDIGTSPLYAMREAFGGSHPLPIDQLAVYGVLSLIVWAVLLIVSLKYVLILTRADNDGEGGIMALVTLIRTSGWRGARARGWLVLLGIFGATLFYGDSIITPAISVMSAVEGLQVVRPELESWVVPLAVGILLALFSIQRSGTQKIGRLFGPVMAVWFSTIGVLGALSILDHPSVLAALSPHHAIRFFAAEPTAAFLALGAVVLVVTGVEALYADIGHVGRRPVAGSWFWVVLPALVLNYMGQGALLLHDPQAVDNPFFRLAPGWGAFPLLVLATMASVIASQAVITGAFSISRQAMQLGLLPRLAVRYTSPRASGQTYMPAVNTILMLSTVLLVIGFGSSSSLAAAYGIAVTGTLAIDTILATVVIRTVWGRSRVLALAFCAFFLVIELTIIAANAAKVLHGGWFPLTLGAVLFLMLTTWHLGMRRLTSSVQGGSETLETYVSELEASRRPPTRIPGTAVFLSPSAVEVPQALRTVVARQNSLNRRVLIVHVTTMPEPTVRRRDRVEVDDVYDPRRRHLARTCSFWLHGGAQRAAGIAAAVAAPHTPGAPQDHVVPQSPESGRHRQPGNATLAQAAVPRHVPLRNTR